MKSEDYERLTELRNDMNECLSEIKTILRQNQKTDFMFVERAKTYWVAHLDHALNNCNHPYSISMEKELDKLSCNLE